MKDWFKFGKVDWIGFEYFKPDPKMQLLSHRVTLY